jgi:hemoglobin
MMDEINAPKNEIPTLAEWAGGRAAFEGLTTRFYEKVPNDPVLAPVFAGMSSHHARHVAQFVTEVFGGATDYTANGGSHAVWSLTILDAI